MAARRLYRRGAAHLARAIATKAETIGPLVQWAIPQPVDICFPPGHITREAETSLRVLKVDTSTYFRCISIGLTGGGRRLLARRT